MIGDDWGWGTTTISVKPVKRLFSKRQQWTFEIRAANGERLDPRETFFNRDEASAPIVELVAGSSPVELVVYDTRGNVESRERLR